MLFALNQLLLLVQALLLIDHVTASPISRPLPTTRDIVPSNNLTDAVGLDNVFINLNDKKDGIGMNIWGTWGPGKFLEIYATSKFSEEGGYIFTRDDRDIITGEAMINRIKDIHYNVKVTFVDFSDTNKLLAIYVNGQIDGTPLHKSVSIPVVSLEHDTAQATAIGNGTRTSAQNVRPA